MVVLGTLRCVLLEFNEARASELDRRRGEPCQFGNLQPVTFARRACFGLMHKHNAALMLNGIKMYIKDTVAAVLEICQLKIVRGKQAHGLIHTAQMIGTGPRQ